MSLKAGVRAWRVNAAGITSIVFSLSRNRAKFRAYRAAMEAGFKLSLGEIKARRAPEYDKLIGDYTHNVCLTESYLKDKI